METRYITTRTKCVRKNCNGHMRIEIQVPGWFYKKMLVNSYFGRGYCQSCLLRTPEFESTSEGTLITKIKNFWK